MTSRILKLNIAMTALVALAVPLQLPAQTYTTFDAPAAIATIPNSVTQSGVVAGEYYDANFVQHGFLRAADGAFTTFDGPDAQVTVAQSINQPGEIAGYYRDANTVYHGFLRAVDGTITTIDPPTSIFTLAASINQGGAITGYWESPAAEPGLTTCFLRAADGTFTTFSPPGSFSSNCLAINNDGVIAGYYIDASIVAHGFLRAADGTFTTIDVPGAGTGGFGFTPIGGIFQGTVADAINQAGTITGFWVDANFLMHGFVRAADGTITTFDASPNSFTFPGAINPAGEIAGYWCDSAFNTCHGFLRTAEGVITSFDPPGSIQTFPNNTFNGGFGTNNQVSVGINPAGAFTGSYFDENFNVHGFVCTP